MTALTAPSARGRSRPRNPNRPAWEEPPSAVGQSAKGLTLGTVVLLIVFPVYCVVLTSISTPGAINRAGGLVIVPDGITLDAYTTMLSDGPVRRALVVTFAITAVGTAISMVVSVLCAYGLSRSRSLGHRFLLLVLVVTMFVNGGLIPTFLVVSELGGYGKYWSLILPSAVSVFNILVLRSFYSSTAAELIDAARMDGANEWRILWSVVLPTSRAVTAVITLFYAVGYWNTFFNVMLYLPTDSQKWPLQYVLYEYVNLGMNMPGQVNSGFGVSGHSQTAPLSLQMAVVVLTLLPIAVVFPFMQKHFAKGMLTGAIKG
ncbi:carbohydrate ABC transporter permease [Actinacidiphila bryophytorum]|uniref:ABC transporter (Permease) n=1 Tax=Actinacidiphila bryophytorum TaxID=1436133 RepID=A0A9W4MA38_9ACTN|nr:carbohydrate ABC transporter permease [Actinacidiphila bryophytorum]MBM9435075.1 carbohydrate ABC transporter permease [Actinacidiphila bryophytorum]MBN6545510.1 carbohydrate ABC transporter permease [Actinacidiphila bryophytorum]CAG7642961.1 putative ABC transporter (permease) [Actinacidiphila bryophytorum]